MPHRRSHVCVRPETACKILVLQLLARLLTESEPLSASASVIASQVNHKKPCECDSGLSRGECCFMTNRYTSGISRSPAALALVRVTQRLLFSWNFLIMLTRPRATHTGASEGKKWAELTLPNMINLRKVFLCRAIFEPGAYLHGFFIYAQRPFIYRGGAMLVRRGPKNGYSLSKHALADYVSPPVSMSHGQLCSSLQLLWPDESENITADQLRNMLKVCKAVFGTYVRRHTAARFPSADVALCALVRCLGELEWPQLTGLLNSPPRAAARPKRGRRS